MNVSGLSVAVLAVLARHPFRAEAPPAPSENASITLTLPAASSIAPGTRLVIGVETTTTLRIEADEELWFPPPFEARLHPGRVTVERTRVGWKLVR